MVRRLASLCCALLIIALAANSSAQQSSAQDTRSIALILDASGSIINPAVIVVRGLDHRGARVNMEDGTFVATDTTSAAQLPVPPGKYVLELPGQKLPLDLKEGQRMEINLK